MAKSARASRNKENKARLRAKLFGPQENLRTERLSAKLLEIATRPKPVQTTDTNLESDVLYSIKFQSAKHPRQPEEMEVDTEESKVLLPVKQFRRSRIRKRNNYRKTAIVFPRYKRTNKPKKQKTQ